jgi:hypothetical protein
MKANSIPPSRLHVHRVAAVGEVEVLLLLLVVAGAETEVTFLVDLGSGLAHVLSLTLLIREVLLDDIVRLHVDLLVGVVLALVDLLHATNLFDEEGIAVDGLATSTTLVGILVHLTDLENVLKTVKSNLDDLVVRACKQIAKRLDAAALDQVANLSRLLQTTTSSVADCPAGLLSCLEVTVLEEVDERGDDVGVDDSLDLGRVASGDVGDGPASLLADSVLSGAQQGEQSRERAAVDDDLSLNVISSNNVSDGSKCGGLDGGGSVHQELYKAAGNASLNDGLDLVVGSIGEVGDGPAGIDKDLVIEGVYELGKDGERRLDLLYT